MTPLQLFWSSQPVVIVRACFAATLLLLCVLMFIAWTEKPKKPRKPHKHNDPDWYAGA